MNWKMIFLLSGLGVLMGLAGVYGWMSGFEIWIWIGLMLIAGALLGNTVKTKHFWNGFLTAALWSVLAGIIEIALLDTYLANNPETAAKFENMSEGFSPALAFLISIPFGAAISGVVLGLLTLLFGKLLGEKPAPAPVETVSTEQPDTTGQ